ncbi:MAG: sugar ABC transporter permease, partial [SAR202 cluster bacterium]|nr:sugar ABC transporter permease [SAR202 cluster bacterium]
MGAASRRRSRSDAGAAFLFLAPNLAGFLLFTLLPLAASLVLSFTDWQMLNPEVRFVGFGNFVRLLGFSVTPQGWQPNDPAFWHYLYNTVFLLLGVPFSMAASLALAVLVNQRLPGVVLFRTLYYLPTICNGIAIYMLWRLLFHADLGLLNRGLSSVGIPGPDWLGATEWAKPALVVMSIWIAAGGNNMLIYLAALQGVPPELHEAADLDGATRWQ